MTMGSGGCAIGNVGVKITNLIGGSISNLISELTDIKIGDEIVSIVWECANATGNITLQGGSLTCTSVSESEIVLVGSGMIRDGSSNHYSNLWSVRINKLSIVITFYFVDGDSGLSSAWNTTLTTCSLNKTYLISKS